MPTKGNDSGFTHHLPDGSWVTVQVYPSAGGDGAIVVQVDTATEPDAIPLRININDARVYGPAWTSRLDGQVQS